MNDVAGPSGSQTTILDDARILRAVLRQDLVSFIEKVFGTVSPGDEYLHNWHIEAIAWHLQQCLEGRIKRLIITVPPRSLKSICASVAFPAWVLGHDPTSRIICASYSADLACKATEAQIDFRLRGGTANHEEMFDAK